MNAKRIDQLTGEASDEPSRVLVPSEKKRPGDPLNGNCGPLSVYSLASTQVTLSPARVLTHHGAVRVQLDQAAFETIFA